VASMDLMKTMDLRLPVAVLVQTRKPPG